MKETKKTGNFHATSTTKYLVCIRNVLQLEAEEHSKIATKQTKQNKTKQKKTKKAIRHLGSVETNFSL